MKVSTFAGGREVVASGTLILAGGDVVANVFIEDISYVFIVAHGIAPPTLALDDVTAKTLQFTIAGSYNSPCQWVLPFVGTINGRTVSMSIVVTWFAALNERPASAKIDYTFTASPVLNPTPNALAGLLG